ncbi:MAG: hypothetical protein ABT08_11085 [Microbacterium sp. SCN 71-21]|nr:MAG: hypothetical protein ABT08_11085 [Microbacterium sp. SCN 71-21]
MLAALGTLHGCGGSDDAGPSVPGPSDPPRLACADITAAALGIPRLELAAPETVAAASAGNPAQSVPAHCRLQGRLNLRNSDVDGKAYAIGFELRMPDTWNGRFFFQGGGGTDGAVNPALGTLTGAGASTNALSMGFAVASTDGGHTSESEPIVGGSLFGLDPQARVDYGYNAVGTVTPTAKAILQRFYGRGADHSYFVGCSNGGRQAMVAASRFADQFDGIVAGNPGFNLPQAAVQHAWDNQAFAAVAPRTGGDRPIISQAFSSQDMQLVADRTVAACDALDGAADGMIDDPVACKAAFKPEDLACPGAKADTCLSAPQVDALKKVFGGPRNSKGEALYADWPYDAGVATMGWRFWKLGTSTTEVPNSLIATLGDEIPITGGMACDGTAFEKTLVAAGAPPRSNVVAALGFYGADFHMGFGISAGWQVFGPRRRVTRSSGNRVYDVDGIPMLDLYRRYLGEEEFAGLPTTGLRFPLQIHHPEAPDETVVRAVLGVDHADGSMYFGGDIPVGAVVQLMRGTFGRLTEAAADAARQVEDVVDPAAPNAAAAILVSCIGRRILMGSTIEDEVVAVAERLNDPMPRIGFYSLGEISPYPETRRAALHNETMTIVTFSERAVSSHA